jgi:hypothetical protein
VSRGVVAYDPPDQPPAPQDVASGWEVELGNARFTELENGTPALIVVLQLKARDGAGMELWLESPAGVVARWTGGSSRVLEGTVCFQLRLVDKGEALQLPKGDYFLTLVFRDPAHGPMAVRREKVTSFAPKLSGTPPAGDSAVFRDLLGCPRGS